MAGIQKVKDDKRFTPGDSRINIRSENDSPRHPSMTIYPASSHSMSEFSPDVSDASGRSKRRISSSDSDESEIIMDGTDDSMLKILNENDSYSKKLASKKIRLKGFTPEASRSCEPTAGQTEMVHCETSEDADKNMNENIQDRYAGDTQPFEYEPRDMPDDNNPQQVIDNHTPEQTAMTIIIEPCTEDPIEIFRNDIQLCKRLQESHFKDVNIIDVHKNITKKMLVVKIEPVTYTEMRKLLSMNTLGNRITYSMPLASRWVSQVALICMSGIG